MGGPGRSTGANQSQRQANGIASNANKIIPETKSRAHGSRCEPALVGVARGLTCAPDHATVAADGVAGVDSASESATCARPFQLDRHVDLALPDAAILKMNEESRPGGNPGVRPEWRPSPPGRCSRCECFSSPMVSRRRCRHICKPAVASRMRQARIARLYRLAHQSAAAGSTPTLVRQPPGT